MEIVVRTHVGAKGGRRIGQWRIRDAAFPGVVATRLVVSQVSHEGIRPISINGQGDTCCLTVMDITRN